MYKRKHMRSRALFAALLTFLCQFPGIVILKPDTIRARTQGQRTKSIRQDKFRPHGVFMLLDQPTVFEVDTLRVQIRPDDVEQSGVHTLKWIPPRNVDAETFTYKFKTLVMNRDVFHFSTVTLNGVRFVFRGQFLKKGAHVEENEPCTGKPVFEGRLTRLSGNRKTATAWLRFMYACYSR